MTIQMFIAAALIIVGLLFMIASLAGIIRLPDFFARLHAQGVGDTLGAFLILAGMMVWTGANLLSIKILLIFIIILLTNPLGTNLMMIAAINRVDYQGYASKMKGEDNSDQHEKEEKSDTEPDHKAEPESEPVTVPEKESENVSMPEPVSEHQTEPVSEPEPEPEPLTVQENKKGKTPEEKKCDPKPDKRKKQGKTQKV